jgi:hypothetical protein
METKAKTKTQKTKSESSLQILPVKLREAKLWIKGTAPLIQHNWSEKALNMLRMTSAERRKQPKVARDPSGEGSAACYRTESGEYGLPAMAVKSAMIQVAHRDAGLPRTTVRKAIRFREAGVIPMHCSEPKIREDVCRVGMNQTDLRYRPEFSEWSAEITFLYDADLLTISDVINLVNRAGFSVGIGEWRPEKDGEYGTFEVDPEMPVSDKPAEK